MKRWLTMVLVAMILYGTYTPISAKEEMTSFVLYVKDDQQHSLDGVEVILQDEKQKKHTWTSDDKGRIHVQKLKVGKYQVEVQPLKGYQNEQTQEVVITPYNMYSQIEMTIYLQREQHRPLKQYDALLLFFCLCNVMLYVLLYIFKSDTHENFTQSFDDFVL